VTAVTSFESRQVHRSSKICTGLPPNCADRGRAGKWPPQPPGMGKKRELRTHWQRVAKLILAKEDVLTVSRALELALFLDAKLDVSKL
jgi:hypothetical protein